MPTIDFTSAYRDATKGSTIKALQQRRAEMEAANAERKPRPVASPWQGAANVADTISGAIREGRLANQEAAGRERFAQLLAGGLAPDEIGEALGLDPETTMKFQERTWAKEDTAETRKYDMETELRKHGYDVDAATARVQAEKDAAAEAARVATVSQDDQQAAALVLADHNATIDEKQAAQKVIDDAKVAETEQGYKQETAAELAETQRKQADQWGAVTAEDAAQYGPDSDVAKNPGLYHINRKTGDIERIDQNAFANMSPAAKEFDIQSAKDNQDWVATGRAQSVSNQAQLDKVLGDLDTYNKDSGYFGWSGVGAPSGVVTGYLGDEANRVASNVMGNPDPVTMRENVRMVAQQSLKAVLGTQFAASEGEGVMARAYDPGAQPSENARRIRLLKVKLQQVAKYNDLRADWLASHPSMQGFVGPSPAEIQADFLAYTNSPEFTGGGGADAAAPATASAAAPEVGAVVDGFVFQGGDPSKPVSWKPQ